MSTRSTGSVRSSVIRFIRSTTCALLIGTTVLSGCGVAGTHPGVTVVPSPAATEQDANKWFAYYQDQVDAYKGVVLPPSDQSPTAAKQGYQRAVVYWGDKVNSAKSKSLLAWIGVLVIVPLLIIGAAGGSAADGFSAQVARP